MLARLAVRISGTIVAVFGVVALLGWALGLPFLASLGSDKIPMAPSTALLFVSYGIAVLQRARLPLGPRAHRVAVVIGALGASIALLLLPLALLGIHPAAERLGFAVVGTLGETPVGHMSPVTATCFLLASASLLGSLPSCSSRPWLAQAAWWTARLLLATSFMLLLAYVYGAPLFYSGAFIPPAATTSLAFCALGTALLVLAGRQAWSPARGAEPAVGVPYALVLVLVVLAAGIVSVGGLYFRSDLRRHRAELERELATVAELKAGELGQWRAERLGDASLFLGNAPFATLVRRLFDNPQDAEALAQVRSWLTKVQAHYPYDQVGLLDGQGAERLAVPGGRAGVSSVIVRRVPEILQSGAVTFEDFYRHEHDGRVYLSVLVPILDERSRALGLVALRLDPEAQLYPLVSRWPTAIRTAEARLIHRASQDVLAAKTVLGQAGTVEGRDDRGLPVIAAPRAVPGSPWLLVTRMDAAEADAPLRERLWVVILLVGGMLAAAAAGVGIVWREQRLRDFRERYETEQERAWLHDVVARSLNEVYVFDPQTLRFRFGNRGACRNIGYTQEELAGLTPLDLEPQFTTETFRAMLEPLRAAERPVGRFETVHRRKDGSEYPVEVHLQLVDSGAGAVFLAVINDITKRRSAEIHIRHLNRVYAVLSDVNQAIVRVREPQALFAEVCRIAVETGGFQMAWIGLLDAKAGLRPVAHAGVADGYLDALQIELGEGPRGLGPTGSALREGRHDVCNDIEHDPRSGPWRDHALARGFRASAALPLTTNGATVGTLNLYASEAGFFDAEELRLLDEMTLDLSFALEMDQVEGARLRLATAIEQSPVSVTITDTDGRIEYVNPAFTRITGYTPEEALGGNHRMLKSGQQQAALYRELWTTIGAGQTWHGEIVNRRKDGSLYPQELTVTPVRDKAGRLTHYVAISQDVTERRQAEAALRASEERYRTLFERNLAGVYRTTLDGRVLECNDAFARIFGYASREEVLAAGADALYLAAADRASFVERLEAHGLVVNHEFEGRRKDGAAVSLLENAHLVAAAEPDAGAIVEGTLMDITERRRLEAQLRQAQKLEAIGQLAGGVAHDFNNILGVITGYGEMAQRQLGTAHPVRARVDQMLKAAERAAALTRQLLAFSRKQVMQPKALDLNATIVDTQKMLGRLIGENVEVLVRTAPGLGTVKADPGQVEQIILNLAVNARDAMPKGGRLTIETANVELDEDWAAVHPPATPRRYVMLAISDTGVGMDPETQGRIFEPFFTTKPPGEGTGLGLATVYGIVKQSGGHVAVYSEPGRGATFKVYLPRVDESPGAARPTGPTAEGPRGRETILLVEDTETLRGVIRETLDDRGYTVIAASNGEEALELARKRGGPIDLLLTDVVMPKLGGADLARLLQALRPGMRVLYMSGYTSGALLQHGVAEGVMLLEKPFTGDKLARTVREALDRPAPAG